MSDLRRQSSASGRVNVVPSDSKASAASTSTSAPASGEEVGQHRPVGWAELALLEARDQPAHEGVGVGGGQLREVRRDRQVRQRRHRLAPTHFGRWPPTRRHDRSATRSRGRRRAPPAPGAPGRCGVASSRHQHVGRQAVAVTITVSIHSSSSTGQSATIARHVADAPGGVIGRWSSLVGGCSRSAAGSGTNAARLAAITADTVASMRAASSTGTPSSTTSATGAIGGRGGVRRSVPSRAAVTSSRQWLSSASPAALMLRSRSSARHVGRCRSHDPQGGS